MTHIEERKILIVEGKTDRERLLEVLDEPVKILCTYGTLSEEQLEEWAITLHEEMVYILVDADDPGNRLRQRLKHELPNAKHLYTRRVYREVARTPYEHLAKVLFDVHFEVKEHYLLLGE